MFVDGQRSLFGDGQSGSAEIEVFNICLSPQGHEHLIAREYLPVLECRYDLRDAIPPNLFDGLSPTITSACLLEALHKCSHEFCIEKLKRAFSPIDNGDLHAECGEDRRIFQGDDASA